MTDGSAFLCTIGTQRAASLFGTPTLRSGHIQRPALVRALVRKYPPICVLWRRCWQGARAGQMKQSEREALRALLNGVGS